MKKLKLIFILIPYILLSQEVNNSDITVFDESVSSIIKTAVGAAGTYAAALVIGAVVFLALLAS